MCLRIVNNAQLPENIKKCRFGDNECIKGSINELIKLYPNGIPELNISPFNDFRPSDLQLWDSPKVGGTWITFRLTNQVVRGCENATVTRVSGFAEDPAKSKIQIELNIPRMIHRSQYEMDLRWLTMVQTNTTGPCYAEFQNVSLVLNIKVIVMYKMEKRYLKIYELVPELDLGRFTLKLDGLYKENEDLTQAVNRVYNENWIELWNDVEPTVISSYGRRGAELLDKIFATISYDDMFVRN
ncbi:circadian clock-controlled protein daywake-like isoform X1 [Drosophila albomicans]|uniref:Circadian clock-controlled protein daywake-like isoform X1 n=2 Tax=Drosophila albomicans TaxID=7291 RepID=A0A6P8WRK4_DROAB|nr:circadian clock-controlled protein daywake-like isoform X1 [Drosophila albomicans]